LTITRAVALVAVNVLVLAQLQVWFVRPALAIWLLLLAPARLVAVKLRWDVRGTERFVLAAGLTLAAVVLGGLVLNTALPVAGVPRPLDPVPTLIAADLALLALMWWRRDLAPARIPRPRLARAGVHVPWPVPDVLVVSAAALATALAAAGAVRLNNGAGGGVTATALVVVTVVFAAALRLRHRLREPALHLTIYLQSLTLLVMTSLRGWYTTGHDIQHEFQVLGLTSSAGQWRISALPDAYNACLSITILPAMLTGLTGTPLVDTFKIYTQLLFALTPVAVYLIARRSASPGPALLGVIFFVAFPTFFTDMPFLNRQEIAFLFLSAAILAICQVQEPLARRRRLFAVLSTGTVLSHYSTTYILIGVVVIAGCLRAARRGWEQVRPAARSVLRPPPLVAGPLNIALLVVTAFLWSNTLTHTDQQIGLTLRQTAQEILEPGSAESRSSDVAYNLFSRQRSDPGKRLADLEASTLAETSAGRATGGYLPRSVLEEYPVTLVPAEPLPLTPAGRAMAAVHVQPATVNGLVRAGSARLLQIFVFAGLAAALLRFLPGRRRFHPPAEIVLLGTASFAAVVSQVVLPAVSVNYGVLRAFQQALIILSPFLAVGAAILLSWLRSWANHAAAGLGLAFLASLTGLLPQLTGGYPAQLHLNNAGPSYDVYYPHQQDLAAADWLTTHIPVRPGDVQYQIETHRFASYPLPALNAAGSRADIFPTLLRTDGVVLLDYTVVTKHRAVIAAEGDQLSYAYPMRLLQQTKSLVYDNGGAQVYR
jgi:uncharacterized membrane protein